MNYSPIQSVKKTTWKQPLILFGGNFLIISSIYSYVPYRPVNTQTHPHLCTLVEVYFKTISMASENLTKGAIRT